MTLLGKILVVVNLLLSVAVGALIVMTYVARTNWHHAYTQLDHQMKAYDESAKSNQGTIDEVKLALAKREDDLKKAEAAKQAAENQLNNATAGLKQQVAELEKGVHDRDNLLAINVGQLDSRQKEVNYLRTLGSGLQTRLRDKERETEEAQKVATAHEIERNAEHNRNEQLLRVLEMKERELQKVRQGQMVASGSSQRNPPAEDVDGLVKAVDPDSGLITITIGSDAGLGKGNTMEVYRLKPDPTYLGTIQILAVRPNEAVAKPINRTRVPIRSGDTVATNILNRR